MDGNYFRRPYIVPCGLESWLVSTLKILKLRAGGLCLLLCVELLFSVFLCMSICSARARAGLIDRFRDGRPTVRSSCRESRCATAPAWTWCSRGFPSTSRCGAVCCLCVGLLPFRARARASTKSGKVCDCCLWIDCTECLRATFGAKFCRTRTFFRLLAVLQVVKIDHVQTLGAYCRAGLLQKISWGNNSTSVFQSTHARIEPRDSNENAQSMA